MLPPQVSEVFVGISGFCGSQPRTVISPVCSPSFPSSSDGSGDADASAEMSSPDPSSPPPPPQPLSTNMPATVAAAMREPRLRSLITCSFGQLNRPQFYPAERHSTGAAATQG